MKIQSVANEDALASLRSSRDGLSEAEDLGTDMVPALGLGAERPDPALMQRPPRARHERLLDRRLLARAYLFLGRLEATAALAAFFFVLNSGGWEYGETLGTDAPLYLHATAACFSAIVAMQVANVFLCRSEHGRPFGAGPPNRWIWLGVTLELLLVLLIDYTAFGNRLLGTAPLSIHVWLFILPFVVFMVFIEGLRKYLLRD